MEREFPHDLLVTILGASLSLSDILSLATANKNFHGVLSDPEINKRLAHQYGFPPGSSLNYLKIYESMPLEKRVEEAIEKHHNGVVRRLIELYSEKLVEFPMLNHMLIFAARIGNLEAMKIFIEYGADDFMAAVQCAGTEGHIDIVMFLFDQDYISTKYYRVTIVMAAASGELGVVKALVERGAKGHDVYMGFIFAAGHNHIDIVKYLVGIVSPKKHAYLCALRECADTGSVEIAEYLLSLYYIEKNGEHIPYITNLNEAAMTAVSKGEVEVLRVLATKPQYITNKNELMVSCIVANWPQMVEILLSIGADNYNVALSYAVEYGGTEIVSLIVLYVESRPELDYRIDYDDAISLAIELRETEVIGLLESYREKYV
jgi:hypothetical protein